MTTRLDPEVLNELLYEIDFARTQLGDITTATYALEVSLDLLELTLSDLIEAPRTAAVVVPIWDAQPSDLKT